MLPGARAWSWLAAALLAVPAFVHSYAWISIAPGLDGLCAAVLISVLAYFPFLYLPVAAALRRLDPGLEDAGGLARPLLAVERLLFRVVLPQLQHCAAGRRACSSACICLPNTASMSSSASTPSRRRSSSSFNRPSMGRPPICWLGFSPYSALSCWRSIHPRGAASAMRGWAAAPRWIPRHYRLGRGARRFACCYRF